MARKPMHIIAVGRVKTPHWKAAIAHYGGRLAHFRDLTETCVKDGAAALSPADRMSVEGRAILAALSPSDVPICLDEKGLCHTSRELAALIEHISEDTNRQPCFIVGGAYGLDAAVQARAAHTLAFGPMTLPHELAHVVLYEQLYRAESITRRLPYHHD